MCYQNALPFIGFGFLDNVIMISVVSNREVAEVMGTNVYFDIYMYKTSSMFNTTYYVALKFLGIILYRRLSTLYALFYNMILQVTSLVLSAS